MSATSCIPCVTQVGSLPELETAAPDSFCQQSPDETPNPQNQQADSPAATRRRQFDVTTSLGSNRPFAAPVGVAGAG